MGRHAEVGVRHEALEGYQVHSLAQGHEGEGTPEHMRSDANADAVAEAGHHGPESCQRESPAVAGLPEGVIASRDSGQ